MTPLEIYLHTAMKITTAVLAPAGALAIVALLLIGPVARIMDARDRRNRRNRR